MPGTERVEITGPNGDRYDEILTPQAIDLIATLHAELGARRPGAAGRAPRAGRRSSPRGAMLDFLPETAAHPRGPELAGRAARARPDRPAGRDHRADRPQDDDQRPQLGRQCLAGRLRGRQHPAVGEHDRGPAQPEGRAGPDHRLHAPPRARSTRWARTTSWPRSWSGRGAGTWTRSTSSSTASGPPAAWSTSRCTWPPRAQRQLDKGKGPYFYLAKNESHLEARLWNDAFNLAQDCAGHPARHDPGHGADRDDPGRVRDGRDPLRAAGPLRPG